MTTINNLTIEQMREIVDGAPGLAEVCIPCLEDVMYFAKRDDGKWFKWSNGYNQWLEYFGKVDPMDLALDLNDLRTAIAEHDLKPCQHGFDIACLLCGFGTENGVRVWHHKKPKQIESDHVTDIRNHVSLSTQVIEHDEQIKCWSCNKYMTKSQHSANDGFCIHCSNEVDL